MLKCDATLTNRNGNKVAAIKLVRAATGMGLKESKDLVETGVFDLEVATHSRLSEKEVAHNLHDIGVVVSVGFLASDTTLSMLEDALHEAVSMQTMEIADDILKLLTKWRK